MTSAQELAIMAVSNTLPQEVTIDALPAIRDAVKGIISSGRLGDALAAQKAGQLDEGATKALNGLVAALSALGAKLAPYMSGPQASAWRDAIMLSLAKYPLKVAKRAIEEAQGVPFPHGIGSVDAKLHELADEHNRKRKAGLLRLQALERKLKAPPIALPSPEEFPGDGMPLCPRDVAAMPAHIISLGRKLGYVGDDVLAQAEALKKNQTSQIDTGEQAP